MTAPPLLDLVDGARAEAEARLAAVAAGDSLCVIGRRDADGPPSVKEVEGEVAALTELRRRLRRAGEPEGPGAVLEAVLADWRNRERAHAGRDFGPGWLAYDRGGIAALERLRDLVTGDRDG